MRLNGKEHGAMVPKNGIHFHRSANQVKFKRPKLFFAEAPIFLVHRYTIVLVLGCLGVGRTKSGKEVE